MSVGIQPLAVHGSARVRRINPVAKLLASLAIAAPLILTIDVVSAAVALGLVLLLLPLTGIGWSAFWRRTWPIWLAAPLGALTILLYGRPSGQSYFSWGFIDINEGSIQLAVATMLRVLAVGLPSVVLFMTVDVTDLGDGLAQVLHVPARFVLGAMAGLRTVGLFVEDWRSMQLARRARGVAETGRLRQLFGMIFAIFVLAIRRGSKLATTMEARGFGATTDAEGNPVARTWARPSTFGRREWVLVAVGVAISATAVAVAVATGSWNFIFGQS
ncbi:energy-coupling factor transporter transmembrane component T family protein [Microbacterium sp.]|uniref:energy-coupling factor transporter transmembrane component T family protein n=1 Tax=Microbacterium sp. TaxID=51671 RepID=UPI003C790568